MKQMKKLFVMLLIGLGSIVTQAQNYVLMAGSTRFQLERYIKEYYTLNEIKRSYDNNTITVIESTTVFSEYHLNAYDIVDELRMYYPIDREQDILLFLDNNGERISDGTYIFTNNLREQFYYIMFEENDKLILRITKYK